MKRILIVIASFFAFSSLDAQHIYELTEPTSPRPIYEGHLKLGGQNPKGEHIEVNSFYMSMNGSPTIPVMGEFHYSRYPAEQWEEEILKMKAGGLTVIPTYIFWNLHEEVEGRFCWTGNRDVRRFIELCAKHQMPVIVRIGPFCHGEIRNGGLPDWLFTKPLEVRSNDVNYLKYVERLYQEIGSQLQGLYFKDGGPIIGCQIENEHQHSAAPWAICYPGEPKDHTSATYDAGITMVGVSVQDKQITTAQLGDLHMKTLKRMAEEAGILTPLYTATGWGNAAVIGNEAIPVTAAYTYPFWSEPAMSPFCMFKDIQREPDYSPVRYATDSFPSFCAEMGVGIQMIYTRRPIVPARSSEALMVRTLGSGANGIGYYMYHGGSTPRQIGNVGYMQDEPMGMPKISYDFQAPIGEFGLEGKMFRHLRLLHSFVNDFGHLLAPMQVVLPDNYRNMTPDNRIDLRHSARMKEGSGFLFLVNYQDHDTARIDQSNLVVRLNTSRGVVQIPAQGTFSLPKDESVILPFNLSLEGIVLRYATAQPLMKIDDRGTPHYIFFASEGMSPEFVFEKATVRGRSVYRPEAGIGSTFSVSDRQGRKVKITTLTRQEALNSCKVGGRLLITEATVLPDSDESVTLLSMDKPSAEYILYPSVRGWKPQTVTVSSVVPNYSYKKVGARRLTVHFNDSLPAPDVQEYFLQIDYTGDVAMAFMQNALVQDHFYYGEPWMIGLKRYREQLKQEDMSFYFRPLRRNAPYLIDLPASVIPDFSKGPVCRINSVKVVPQYRLKVPVK
ncbi:MAG: glycosyl hydrolase family 35 [Mediterranea massiliensis]|nr:glycosyl hydrolase family 35 [Mediterranea massiliensis]